MTSINLKKIIISDVEKAILDKTVELMYEFAEHAKNIEHLDAHLQSVYVANTLEELVRDMENEWCITKIRQVSPRLAEDIRNCC